MENPEEFKPQSEDKAVKKRNLKEFLKWYVHIDLKDVTNYIALALAIFLLWWGLKNIMKALSLKGP